MLYIVEEEEDETNFKQTTQIISIYLKKGHSSYKYIAGS